MGGSASKKNEENDILISLKHFNPEEEINRTELIIKSLQKLNERVEKLEKEKSNKLIYTIPKIDMCNYSLF